ncbi:MAG TPA: hypothetical protein VFB19_18710 [Mycobacterium sp.]|nr:hypothetical protein [Mycobacterium sp.]
MTTFAHLYADWNAANARARAAYRGDPDDPLHRCRFPGCGCAFSDAKSRREHERKFHPRFGEKCSSCGRRTPLNVDGELWRHRVRANDPLAPYCGGVS